MPPRQTTVDLVRATLAQAPRDSRRPVYWLLAASAVMIVLQIWDVRGRSGPQVTAELLSVLASVSGVALLGLTSVLSAGGAAASSDDREELKPVLQALPLLGFASGILLSAAIALFVARGLLGLHPLRVMVPAAIQAVALYGAWVTVRNATRLLYASAERRAAQAAEARAALSDARIRELQARMQPHFLFNALNTVAALVKSDPAGAEATVEDLSEILRASLDQDAAVWRPLRRELEIVRAFVGVEQRRLGERLRVEWDIDPRALDAAIPALSIQPLMENAIKHGVASRIVGGTVRIAVTSHDSSICIAVSDNGDGFPRGWREGTGLGNLRERLMSLYGSAATLDVDTAVGARVTLALPLRS